MSAARPPGRLQALAVRGLRGLRAHRDAALLAAAALALAACFLPWRLTVERARFDHVIVLDITQSMNVPDMSAAGRPVARLAFAKQALRQALNALPCGSRVGWGVFTEYRSLLVMAPVEVCANLGELRTTLANLDGRMAWIGGSEVAKGLHSGMGIVRQLPERPSLVFVTDGHEAPPLHPRHRPRLDGTPGEVAGLIVGVGQAQPSPIPKLDARGRPLGTWGPDEVLQADPRSRGRGGSVAGEALADDAAGPAAAVGATPGTEHLSGLREPYLRLLASEDGLRFHRLGGAQDLAAALTAPAFERQVPVALDLRELLAPAALLLLLVRLLLRWRDARPGRRFHAAPGGVPVSGVRPGASAGG
ncbi:vWA domain-containing protein [Aquincola sp. MAHUQ-54]|uniref:VWA domain-containing protein n=1 Tax=Aquincola agrisoli TaxID=3119538 RepID=A0AAW9Q8M0_9BURK